MAIPKVTASIHAKKTFAEIMASKLLGFEELAPKVHPLIAILNLI